MVQLVFIFQKQLELALGRAALWTCRGSVGSSACTDLMTPGRQCDALDLPSLFLSPLYLAPPLLPSPSPSSLFPPSSCIAHLPPPLPSMPIAAPTLTCALTAAFTSPLTVLFAVSLMKDTPSRLRSTLPSSA